MILTSPQCGGTHAFIFLLKGLGLKLSGRHNRGLYYESGQTKKKYTKSKSQKYSEGTPISSAWHPPIDVDRFICGHSKPFPTRLQVVSVTRDPRNIMLCHWNRREIECPFNKWLSMPDAIGRATIIPQNWDWSGKNVLRVRYEDIRDEEVQRAVAVHCGVEWRRVDFWANPRSKTWSGSPSNFREIMDTEGEGNWKRLWLQATGQHWKHWKRANL